MIDILETFTLHNWDYTLLKRHNDVAALYVMKRKGVVRYEVWVLRRYLTDSPLVGRKAGDIRTPTNSDWGIYGWTYLKLESAEAKFNELINNEDNT